MIFVKYCCKIALNMHCDNCPSLISCFFGRKPDKNRYKQNKISKSVGKAKLHIQIDRKTNIILSKIANLLRSSIISAGTNPPHIDKFKSLAVNWLVII